MNNVATASLHLAFKSKYFKEKITAIFRANTDHFKAFLKKLKKRHVMIVSTLYLSKVTYLSVTVQIVRAFTANLTAFQDIFIQTLIRFCSIFITS